MNRSDARRHLHVSDKTVSDVGCRARARDRVASSSRALAITRAIFRRSSRRTLRTRRRMGTSIRRHRQKAVDRQRSRARLKPQLDSLKEPYKNDPKRWKRRRTIYAAHRPPTPLSALIDHIDHIARVASGTITSGWGPNFDGGRVLPEGVQDIRASNLRMTVATRLQRGDVRKVLGENFLRAFAEADRVRAAVPPRRNRRRQPRQLIKRDERRGASEKRTRAPGAAGGGPVGL